MTVYNDHLEGYAWAENAGWIRLGTHTGGGTHTYTNTSTTNYGVNRDTGTGALSGYAWSTNVGWINFAPANGGVTISAVRRLQRLRLGREHRLDQVQRHGCRHHDLQGCDGRAFGRDPGRLRRAAGDAMSWLAGRR